MDSVASAINTGYICTAIASVILLARLYGTLYLYFRIDLSCVFLVASLVIVVARGVINYCYLNDGTAGQTHPIGYHLSPDDLQTIKTGSVLAIVTRVLVTTFYWLQVSLLLLFYIRVLPRSKRWRIDIRYMWLLIGATYVVVILATCLECRPFRLYWEVSSHPPTCAKAYIQLYLQGVFNIVLDLVLLFISYPIVVIKRPSRNERIRLGFLYFTGVICITVTIIRIVLTKDEHSSQQVRSIWASIQEAVAAAVANIPTAYGNWRVYSRKSRPPTMPHQSFSDSNQSSRPTRSTDATFDGHHELELLEDRPIYPAKRDAIKDEHIEKIAYGLA